MPPSLTVYYNTRCPVCDAGINRQRSRLVQAARSGAIAFHDINMEPRALARFGAGLEDIRRSLHGVDAAGRLYTGADCAIEIWRRTPGEGWIAAILGLPVLRQATRLAYNLLANRLYAWNRRKNHW